MQVLNTRVQRDRPRQRPQSTVPLANFCNTVTVVGGAGFDPSAVVFDGCSATPDQVNPGENVNAQVTVVNNNDSHEAEVNAWVDMIAPVGSDYDDILAPVDSRWIPPGSSETWLFTHVMPEVPAGESVNFTADADFQVIDNREA